MKYIEHFCFVHRKIFWST